MRPEVSRYFYRREHWVQRIFTDTELFQTMGAYTVDMIDSCVQLARTQPLRFDRDGLVVVDLAGPLSPLSAAPPEPQRRDAWIRSLAEGLGMHDAWTLTPRSNVRFEDGFNGVVFVDGAVDDPRWYELLHRSASEPQRGTAVRWVQHRAHLRVRGAGTMRLAIRGKLNIAGIATHPRLLVSLDGDEVAEVVADATGQFAIDTRVTAGDDWHDLYLSFSSVGEPERELRDLRMARVEAIEWEPVR